MTGRPSQVTIHAILGSSFNGRTAVSKTANEGSIPSDPANDTIQHMEIDKYQIGDDGELTEVWKNPPPFT